MEKQPTSPTPTGPQDEPQQTGDLIAPSPKRKHLTLRKIFLGAFVIVLLLVTAVYVAAFWYEPDPSVDYLAKLNAKALAVPEADRAWPLYREILVKYDLTNMHRLPGYGPRRNPDYKPSTVTQPATSPAPKELDETSAAVHSFDEIWGPSTNTSDEFFDIDDRIPTSDSRWPAAKEELDKYTDLFEAIRQASRKTSLGLVLRHDYAGHDEYLAVKYKSAMQTKMLTFMLLPFLLESRKFGRLLSLDFHYAVKQQDWQRAMANLQAMVAIGTHVKEQNLFIPQLMGLSLIGMAHEDIEIVLQNQASELPSDLLDELILLVKQSSSHVPFDVSDELWTARDYLQHLYAANGRITYKGAFKLTEAGSPPPQVLSMGFGQYRTNEVLTLIFPWVVVTTGSHQQMLDEVDLVFKTNEQRGKLEPWTLLATPGPAEAFRKKWFGNTQLHYQNWPLAWFVDAVFIDEIILTHWQTKSRADALVAAIAIEKFRRVQERYPDSLAELVPVYLANIPVDIATGDEMLYLLKDGKPVLYSRGPDGDDDKLGERVDGFHSGEQGDWCIYPFEIVSRY